MENMAYLVMLMMMTLCLSSRIIKKVLQAEIAAFFSLLWTRLFMLMAGFDM